jgi:hypothetical protein
MKISKEGPLTDSDSKEEELLEKVGEPSNLLEDVEVELNQDQEEAKWG